MSSNKPSGVSGLHAARVDQLTATQIHRTTSNGRKRYTWRVYARGVLVAHSPRAYAGEKLAKQALEAMRQVVLRGKLTESIKASVTPAVLASHAKAARTLAARAAQRAASRAPRTRKVKPRARRTSRAR